MRKLTLSEMIYRYREENNMGRLRFASEAKLGKTTIEKLENGEVKNPRPESMQKLSVCMGIPLSELWAALRREKTYNEYLR